MLIIKSIENIGLAMQIMAINVLVKFFVARVITVFHMSIQKCALLFKRQIQKKHGMKNIAFIEYIKRKTYCLSTLNIVLLYKFNISKAKIVEKVFANLAKIPSQSVAAYLQVLSKLFYLHHCLLAVTGIFFFSSL